MLGCWEGRALACSIVAASNRNKEMEASIENGRKHGVLLDRGEGSMCPRPGRDRWAGHLGATHDGHNTWATWKHYWVWWAGKIKVFCFLTGRWMAAMNTPYTCGASYIHSKTPRPLYAFTHSSLQLRLTILLCSCIEEALMQAYFADGVTYVSDSSKHYTAHHRTACA